MAKFRFKAIGMDGQPQNGFVEALDRHAAMDQLRNQYQVVDSITQIMETPEVLNMKLTKGYNEQDLAIMCSQFGIILKSGIPVIRCVELIAGQTANKYLKEMLNSAAKDVAAGSTLADALERYGVDLPLTMIETIRAGEEAGTLEVAFGKLQRYFEKNYKMKNKVKSAMIYPMMVLIAAVVVIAIVVLVAVPMFQGMFESMGATLPLPTRMLIGLYNYLSRFGVATLVVAVILVYAILQWKNRTEPGRMFFSKMVLRLPLIGKIVEMSAASQLANTMSTMLTAGLPMIRALDITGHVIENAVISQTVLKAVHGVEEGRTIGSCLVENPHIPELLTEMTIVGEESGNMEETLETVGLYYDNEVELATNRALSYLEPCMTLLLAVVVVAIVLAVYLPMFGMYGGIN